MNVYEARHAGREYCNTEGSKHYKGGDVEAMDLITSLGLQDGFCLGSMIKYSARFNQTRNLDDLKKVSDYAHILCGVEMERQQDDKLDKAIDSHLAEKSVHAIEKAKKLCRERYMAGKCSGCPVGKNAALEQIPCREYVWFYPELAVKMLGVG